MSLLSDLTELKAKVERLRRDADRAQGALEQALATLRKDFDCDTLVAGEKKLKQLEKELRVEETKFQDKLEAFQEEWKEVLNGGR